MIHKSEEVRTGERDAYTITGYRRNGLSQIPTILKLGKNRSVSAPATLGEAEKIGKTTTEILPTNMIDRHYEPTIEDDFVDLEGVNNNNYGNVFDNNNELRPGSGGLMGLPSWWSPRLPPSRQSAYTHALPRAKTTRLHTPFKYVFLFDEFSTKFPFFTNW